MVQMRRSLERFVNLNYYTKSNNNNNNFKRSRSSLMHKINDWATTDKLLSRDLVLAMHRIRDYGNRAAHYNDSNHNQHCAGRELPEKQQLEEAVRRYIQLKSQYEQKRQKIMAQR